MFVHKKNVHSSNKRKGRLCKSHKSLIKVKKEDDMTNVEESKFPILNSDILEHIASYLDTDSALALYRSSNETMQKLSPCIGFWKSLCKMENFHEYTSLKREDADGDERLSWSGGKFHDVVIPEQATLWQKIFMKGIQMRRNICTGNYELWRLFMTDKESLPVKKMSKETTCRELRVCHRKSPFNDQKRRVRINRYWNEEFLVAIQHKMDHSFNDIFVWKWKECQNPEFMYSFDLRPLYPTGLFPTAFFLHKNFLVMMPETGYIREEKKLRSMIRVHDLSDNMALVGSYDFPENGYRRHTRISVGEAPHLHKVGDHAVALCRTPTLMFFIFSLPNCELVHKVPVPHIPERPLELDDLDQRYLMKDNTMMFMFHHPDFFNHLFASEEEDQQQFDQKYGRLLLVDFDKFLKSGEPLDQKLDSKFDSNDDYIEKISVISKTQMACATTSGKVIIRDIISTNKSSASYVERLSIPCPEPMQDECDDETNEENDTDGPNLCTSRLGDIVLIFRHFASGRKIHAYNKEGSILYTINIDAPEFELEKKPGYISIDMDGNFVCAADQNKIILWNSKTGKFINTIHIPDHYNHKEDDHEMQDKFCWKGHTDFAFAEDGVIVIHSQRNFPIAADVLLFW